MGLNRTSAMGILRAIGKNGASPEHISQTAKLPVQDVLTYMTVLRERGFVWSEKSSVVVRLSPKFCDKVPDWKAVKRALLAVDEFEN